MIAGYTTGASAPGLNRTSVLLFVGQASHRWTTGAYRLALPRVERGHPLRAPVLGRPRSPFRHRAGSDCRRAESNRQSPSVRISQMVLGPPPFHSATPALALMNKGPSPFLGVVQAPGANECGFPPPFSIFFLASVVPFLPFCLPPFLPWHFKRVPPASLRLSFTSLPSSGCARPGSNRRCRLGGPAVSR